jgi:hypothetical protein
MHDAGVILLWCRPEHAKAANSYVEDPNSGMWASPHVRVDGIKEEAVQKILKIFNDAIAAPCVDELTVRWRGIDSPSSRNRDVQVLTQSTQKLTLYGPLVRYPLLKSMYTENPTYRHPVLRKGHLIPTQVYPHFLAMRLQVGIHAPVSLTRLPPSKDLISQTPSTAPQYATLWLPLVQRWYPNLSLRPSPMPAHAALSLPAPPSPLSRPPFPALSLRVFRVVRQHLGPRLVGPSAS